MKNRGIVIFLIILAIVIIAVIAGDFMSKRPDKMDSNQFEYSVDEFRKVDKDLIHYKETKNFKIGFDVPTGVTIENDKIYLTGDKKLKVINNSGKLLKEILFKDKPRSVEVADGKIFIVFKKQIQVLNENGELQKEWNLTDEKSFITAIAVSNGNVFVADAGVRKVIRFSTEGEKLNEFNGKATEDEFGFIIPSPYFDIDINDDGELWVVNPGMHALENYTFDGNLRSHWERTSMKTDGFSGCCNPAHYTFLHDGSFVTSEKGLIRIKIYKPSGEFLCVVAPPDKFKNGEHAPDVAVDLAGNIYALDFDRKTLRVFELK
jgi:hypothetical protein